MARLFLPSLRRKATGPAERKDVLLSDFYGHLHRMGTDLGWRRNQDWDVDKAVAEGYARVVWCFKAVEAIAGSSSRLPYRLREGGDEVTDHPLYQVLNKQANPLETGRAFRKRLSSQVLLSKAGAFVEVTRNRGGEIVRLDLLPPGRTYPVPGRGADLLSHFEVLQPNGERRALDPEVVRWVREPHPTDPFSGMTPLEAAGMSIELDYFARLYNTSMMRNDGRPGGVLGVDGEMDESEMDRVESRFGKGPYEAGKISVINGKLTYTDLAARPRDMAYEQLAHNAKTEILVAFGVPESQIGHAAEATFSNAGEEAMAFWQITMTAHNDLVVSAFDRDSDPNLVGYLDTADVAALQAADIARREEARAEFNSGLRSVLSYAELAGIDGIESTPLTRALHMPGGKTPIPASDADAQALGLGEEPDQSPAGPEPPAQEEPPDEQGGGPPGPAGPQPPGGGETTSPPPPPPSGTQPPAGGGELVPLFPDLEAADSPAADDTETKQVLRPRVLLSVEPDPTRDAPTLGGVEWRESDPDLAARDQLETALAGALAADSTRWVERAVARLRSPKARKGTRHWVSDKTMAHDTRAGTKQVDPNRAVDPERVADEAEATTTPLLQAAAAAAAAKVLTDLLGDDAEETDETQLRAWLARLTPDVLADLLALIRKSAARQAMLLADTVREADEAGEDMDGIVSAVRARAAPMATWASGLAVHTATAATEAARDAAAERAAQRRDTVRRWYSQRDDRVRNSHEDADGQERPLGEMFDVGGAELRFPGDPLAPADETAGCRCYLRYRSRSQGRWIPRPAGEPAVNPAGEPERLRVSSG